MLTKTCFLGDFSIKVLKLLSLQEHSLGNNIVTAMEERNISFITICNKYLIFPISASILSLYYSPTGVMIKNNFILEYYTNSNIH